MKSIKGSGLAACPNGCESFEAEFWSLIRPDTDEDLKQALLGGELNLVCCPECRKFFYHDRNIIYFDPGAELLAFVAPNADKKDFGKIKEKMQKDFELLKANLTSLNIFYKPFYLAGLEELKAMVDYEDRVTRESEVVAAIGSQKGYKTAVLKRSSARLQGWPFYIPVAGAHYAREAVFTAAKEVLKENPSLHMLDSFIKDISAGAPLPDTL
jgi:hypothetical protein